jgi:glycosyltransferase involved in cell wall biosynthesis
MISVLLPYRNARATIGEAIGSVLRELGGDDELVAIDDGSTDGSGRIVGSMHDARIRRLETAGIGVARALAVGLDAARGEILGRMDADDVSLAGRFAAEREMLEGDPSLGAVGVQIEVFGVESEGMRAYVAWQNALVSAEDHARAIYVESPLCHPATMIRRSALEAVGGFRDTSWPEDWDLWMRMHRGGFGLAKVPRVLFRWRRSPTTVTSRDPRCAPDRLLAARAFHLAAELGDRSFAIWGAGRAGRRLARELETHGRRVTFFGDIDPRKIGKTSRGAPIVEAEAAMKRARDEQAYFVVSVATPGARDIVRSRLDRAGFVERRDYVCAS